MPDPKFPRAMTTLLEQSEVDGFFSRPEAPDRTIAGHLRFTPSDSLTCTLKDAPNGFRLANRDEIHIKHMQGVLSTSQQAILGDLLLCSQNMRGGVRELVYSVGYALTSDLPLPDPTELVVTHLSFRGHPLDQWAMPSALRLTRGIAGGANTPEMPSYDPPTYQPIPLESGQLLSIDAAFDYCFAPSRFEFQHDTSLTLHWPNGTSIQQAIRSIWPLRCLLIFCTAIPITPSSIILGVRSRTATTTTNGKLTLALGGAPTASPIHPEHFAWSMHGDEASVRAIIPKWLRLFEDRQPATDALFRMYIEPVHSDIRFLGISQALESLQRIRRPSTYLDVTEYGSIYEQVCKAIPPSIPEGLRSALKSRLAWGNEVSLRKRFHEAMDGFDEHATTQLCGDANPSEFIEQVVKARNYFTHLDPSNRPTCLDRPEFLINATRAIIMLAFCLLAIDSGTTPKDAAARFARTGAFARLGGGLWTTEAK